MDFNICLHRYNILITFSIKLLKYHHNRLEEAKEREGGRVREKQ